MDATIGGTTPAVGTFTTLTANAASSLTLGTASSAAGSVIFQNATNANTITIQSGVTSTTYTLTLPLAVGGANTALTDVAGDGVLSWVAGGGDVTGDTASVDKEFVRFNSTTGKIIESPATDVGTTTATLSDNADVTFYDATNDGNPIFSYGSSATERLTITPTFSSGTQTLEFVAFDTPTASASVDFGEYRFSVDAALIATIDDGGIELADGFSYFVDTSNVLSESTLGTTVLASALTSLGTIASLVATTVDINGGNIDGTVIGGAATAAGTFTSLTTDTGGVSIPNTQSYTGAGIVTLSSAAGQTLIVDSGTVGDLNIGTATNAKTITIGNVTGATALVLNTGTGGVNIGDNANTKTIDIGGVDASGTDTIRIATEGTLADVITIGNSNAATTVTITGGDDWSITAAGALTVVSSTFNGLATFNADVDLVFGAGENLNISAGAAPTADMVVITNAGQGTTITAIDGLQIDFVTAAVGGSVDNAGLRIVIDPVGATEAGDTVQAIDIPNVTNPTGAITAIQIGTGWDVALSVEGGTAGTALVEIGSDQTSGIIAEIGTASAVTLTGLLTGQSIDLNTNYTSINQSATGLDILLDTASNTSGTILYKGIEISGGALTQNTAGSTAFKGIEVTIPAITQTGATITADGLEIITGSITTGGTENAIKITATGVVAGTLTGLNISGISQGAGATEEGINVGAGWDIGLRIGDATNFITLTEDSTGLTYGGTARATRQVTLSPEYPGATLTGDGSSNTGTMTSDFCESGFSADIPETNTGVCNTATDIHNYYEWAGTGGSQQDYDIWVRWRVPDNFASFASVTDPIKVWAKAASNANTEVTAFVYDTDGDLENTGGTLVDGATWTQTSVEAVFDEPATTTYTPGSFMTIRIVMSDGGTDTVYVGEITIDYLANN